jgi:hypothetical protein
LGTFEGENGIEEQYSTRYNVDLGQGSYSSFKVGDVLDYGIKDANNNYSVKQYMATQNSHQVNYAGDNPLTSLKGWSQTYDGTLA